MPSALELLFHPDADNLPGRAKTSHTPAHSQHIGIVMSPGHAGGVHIGAQSAANALDLVGSNGNANASAAEHDAPVSLAADNLTADLLGDIRIIHRLSAKSAHILDLDVTEFLQHHLDLFLQSHSTMVTANNDFHKYCPLVICIE